MPTHLHLFCQTAKLKETLEDFKRWTGHQAAKHLNIDGKRLWQREWFDHWSRSTRKTIESLLISGTILSRPGWYKN